MKKKVLAAVVMLMVTFSFASCNDVKEVANVLSEAMSEAQSEIDSEVAASEAGETAAETAKEYYHGVNTETGYQSEFFGYQFVTPENVMLADEATIAQLAGLAQDVVAEGLNDKLAELAANSVVYEMYASYADGTNLVIAVEKNKYNMKDLNVLADGNEQQFSQMTNMSVTVLPERENVTIAGRDFLKMSVINQYEGVELHQDMYMAFANGMIISMNVTYMEGNEAEAQNLVDALIEY